MSDNRARIWFSLFVLAVFCLGGAGGFFLGRQVPRGPYFAGEAPPPGLDGPQGRGGFGGPGAPGPRRGGPGRGGPLFGGEPGGPPPLPPELVNRLSSELQLDSSQQAQLKKILDERRERLDTVHREARERFDKEQRDLHAAIRAMLRADQQERFDRFLDRRR
ncbi:MAG TPA: hypothetical protein VKH34_12540 [Vicinamibacterales bacterium]|nr:hypothetical protein [Vicinamibacterales bacterium]